MVADRHKNNRDENEPAIRAVLHKVGIKAYCLTGPDGMADLLCVGHRTMFLMEIKSHAKAKLRPSQEIIRDEMHHSNVGYYVVWDAEGALDAVLLESQR